MDYTKMGRNIQRCRVKRGLTQEQLAERADLSVSHVRQVEIGRKSLSLSALDRVSEALDAPVQSLLVGEEADNEARLQELLTKCAPWEQEVIADVAEAVIESLRKHQAA